MPDEPNTPTPDTPPSRLRRWGLTTAKVVLPACATFFIGALLATALSPLGLKDPNPLVEVKVERVEVPVAVIGDGPPPDAGQGWVCDPDEVKAVADTLEVKVFADTPAGQVGDLPRSVYGWKLYEQLMARGPPVKNQGQVGSCVSFGTNAAVERTLVAEIVARKGSPAEWSRFTEEATYGGSRVEIGGGRIRGDGSVGAWAAQFVTRYGMVPRKKYDSIDLTTYSESLCRQWGDRGVPDEFEAVARKFPVKAFVQVKSLDDVKKSLSQGYFIAVCSNQGFTMARDANGVARASGSWAHCMCIDGYHTTDDGRVFVHITNSWGDRAHTGPTGWGSPGPDGFWAEGAVVDRMVKQGDTWAFSGVTGFLRRKLDWFVIHGPDRAEQFARRLAVRPLEVSLAC